MKKFGLSFGLPGIGFLMAAVVLFICHCHFLSVSVRTQGEVVEIKTIKADDGTSYLPVLRFHTQKDSIVVTHPSIALSPPYSQDQFKIGEKVDLLYNAHHPQNIYLTGFFENWGLIIIFTGAGILCSFIGIGAYRAARKETDKG